MKSEENPSLDAKEKILLPLECCLILYLDFIESPRSSILLRMGILLLLLDALVISLLYAYEKGVFSKESPFLLSQTSAFETTTNIISTGFTLFLAKQALSLSKSSKKTFELSENIIDLKKTFSSSFHAMK